MYPNMKAAKEWTVGCGRIIAGKQVYISHLVQIWWAEPQDYMSSPSENPTTTKE
jgi:hypothetical protein